MIVSTRVFFLKAFIRFFQQTTIGKSTIERCIMNRNRIAKVLLKYEPTAIKVTGLNEKVSKPTIILFFVLQLCNWGNILKGRQTHFPIIFEVYFQKIHKTQIQIGMTHSSVTYTDTRDPSFLKRTDGEFDWHHRSKASHCSQKAH